MERELRVTGQKVTIHMLWVGLAARDGAEGVRMRDMLVLLLSVPEGQA